MQQVWCFAASALVSVSVGSRAHAFDNGMIEGEETPPAEVADASPSRPKWYGWQTLLVDGASAGAMAASPAIGLAAFAFAPPAVHAFHRNTRSMLLSLTFRAVAPVALGIVGFAATTLAGPRRSDDDTGGPGLVAFGSGMFTGMVAAVILDATWLARERPVRDGRREDEPPSEPPLPSTGVRVAPSLAASPRGAAVGITGTF